MVTRVEAQSSTGRRTESAGIRGRRIGRQSALHGAGSIRGGPTIILVAPVLLGFAIPNQSVLEWPHIGTVE